MVRSTDIARSSRSLRIRKSKLICISAIVFVTLLICLPKNEPTKEIRSPLNEIKFDPNQLNVTDHIERSSPTKRKTPKPGEPIFHDEELTQSKFKNTKTYFQMMKKESFSEEEIQPFSALTPAEVKVAARKNVIARLATHLENKKD